MRLNKNLVLILGIATTSLLFFTSVLAADAVSFRCSCAKELYEDSFADNSNGRSCDGERDFYLGNEAGNEIATKTNSPDSDGGLEVFAEDFGTKAVYEIDEYAEMILSDSYEILRLLDDIGGATLYYCTLESNCITSFPIEQYIYPSNALVISEDTSMPTVTFDIDGTDVEKDTTYVAKASMVTYIGGSYLRYYYAYEYFYKEDNDPDDENDDQYFLYALCGEEYDEKP